MARPTDRPQTVQEVLGSGQAPEGGLFSAVKRMDTLEQLVRQSLPEQIASHVFVGGPAPDSLGLIADSSVIAARLRLLLPEIQNHLAAAGFPVRALRVRVSPGFMPAPPPPAPPAPQPLSDKARQMLLDLALSLEGDPGFQASLENLANAGRPGYQKKVVPPPPPPPSPPPPADSAEPKKRKRPAPAAKPSALAGEVDGNGGRKKSGGRGGKRKPVA